MLTTRSDRLGQWPWLELCMVSDVSVVVLLCNMSLTIPHGCFYS